LAQCGGCEPCAFSEHELWRWGAMVPLGKTALLLASVLDGARWLEMPPALASAAVTYTNLEDMPQTTESLAEAFKVSLIRPPDEPANSGSKMLLNVSSIHLLEDEEKEVLDGYDALFEKYSLFCNGRWLGAQVLQDSQDLMYLQHITYMRKPDVIIETGTYKGGLTYFFASILDWIDREAPDLAAERSGSQILSVDRHHPHLVFAANWFCPVCADCIKPYETDAWRRKVRFVQGMADTEEVYAQIMDNLFDLKVLRFVDQNGNIVPEQDVDLSPGARDPTMQLDVDAGKVVMVNLDANHEFDGLIKELFFFAPFVSLNSYLVVQDTKLDKIWGAPGPTAALERFLSLAPEGEFVLEPELKFHAYSQHTYLRRAQVTVSHAYFLDKVAQMTKAGQL